MSHQPPTQAQQEQLLKRASKKELSDRISYTYELMMNDIPNGEIKRALIQKYGVNIRTADRYLFCAIAALEDKVELSRKRKLAWYKARKIRLMRDMDPKEKRTPNGVRAINKVLDSMAKMDGVLIDKVDVTSMGEPIQPAASLNPSQFDVLLKMVNEAGSR